LEESRFYEQIYLEKEDLFSNIEDISILMEGQHGCFSRNVAKWEQLESSDGEMVLAFRICNKDLEEKYLKLRSSSDKKKYEANVENEIAPFQKDNGEIKEDECLEEEKLQDLTEKTSKENLEGKEKLLTIQREGNFTFQWDGYYFKGGLKTIANEILSYPPSYYKCEVTSPQALGQSNVSLNQTIKSLDLSSSLESLSLSSDPPSPESPSLMENIDSTLDPLVKGHDEIGNKLSRKSMDIKQKRSYLPLPMKIRKSGKMLNFKHIKSPRNDVLPYPTKPPIENDTESVLLAQVIGLQGMSTELLESYKSFFRKAELSKESAPLTKKQRIDSMENSVTQCALHVCQIDKESTNKDVKEKNYEELLQEKLNENKLYIKIGSKQSKYYLNFHCPKKIDILDRQSDWNSFEIEFPGRDKLKFYHIKSLSQNQNLSPLYKCLINGQWILFPGTQKNVFFLNSFISAKTHQLVLKYFQDMLRKKGVDFEI
jgi:hypothetical protein